MSLLLKAFCILGAVASLINILCLPAQIGQAAGVHTLLMAAVGHGVVAWLGLRWAFPDAEWLKVN